MYVHVKITSALQSLLQYCYIHVYNTTNSYSHHPSHSVWLQQIPITEQHPNVHQLKLSSMQTHHRTMMVKELQRIIYYNDTVFYTCMYTYTLVHTM